MIKKVLIITYYWPPSGGAGVQRWLKFVKYLPGFNVKPIVLTVDPAKASYPVIDESLYEKVPDGIITYRTDTLEFGHLYSKLIPSHKYPHGSFDNEEKPTPVQKISRFIRGNFFIPDARVGWKKYAVRKAREILDQHEIDVIITTGPPHSVHLTGLKLSKNYNIKWIADFRDPWTDILYYNSLYHTPPIKKYDAKLERTVLEKADNIIIVSKSLKQLLVSKSNLILPQKVIVIPNGFMDEDFSAPSKPPADKFIITFTGSLSNNNNKMDAFAKGLARAVKANNDVQFVFRFVGNINKSVDTLLEKYGLANIMEKIDYVPHFESVKYLKSSTAVFFVIRRTATSKGILSGKLFDYLGSRKPIICIGPVDGNAAEIIHECKAGKVIDYDDSEGVFEYLQQLVDRWRKNPDLDIREDRSKNYSVKNLTKKLVETINA